MLGTFDGLFGSYQWRPRVNLSAAAGFPVESTRDTIGAERQFLGIAAEFGPFKDKWDYTVFAVSQRNGGVVDYDIHYQTLHNVTLLGNLQLPARWMLSANLDHRRAPVLTTRNALIGQPVATLRDLLGLFSPSEIEQLAQDRTRNRIWYRSRLADRWASASSSASMRLAIARASRRPRAAWPRCPPCRSTRPCSCN